MLSIQTGFKMPVTPVTPCDAFPYRYTFALLLDDLRKNPNVSL